MSMLSKILFLVFGALAGAGILFSFSGRGSGASEPSRNEERPENAPMTSLVSGQLAAPPQEIEISREWFLGFALGKRIAFDPKIPQRYELIQDCCVVGFDGKSTIHDFTGMTKKLSGFFEARLARLEDGVQGRLAIDALSLDTKDPDRDHEMHEKHLHSKRFPSIVLELKEFSSASWNESFEQGAGNLLGELEIHGAKQRVTIPVSITRQGQRLQVRGRMSLKMSDYGITPPSKFAVIRVQDEVQVWFDIQAKLSAVEAQCP